MKSKLLSRVFRCSISLKLSALALSALTVTAPAAYAQTEYPSRPITMIVPFAPGGGSDMAARVIAQKMSEHLGQSIVVENRSGANGNIGNSYAAKAKPDGYTVLYNTSSITVNPSLYKNLSFDVMHDLAPVGLSVVIPMVLVVNPSMPVSNLKEFIAYAKVNASKLSFGSSGVGNITWLTAFQFLRANNLEITHVPYRGSGPANVDLIGNRIQFMTDTVNNVTGFVRDKRLNILAVATPKRIALFPDVPTFDEAGMPNFEAGAWSGVMVPARTPKSIIQRLNTALNKSLGSPDVQQKLAQQGAEPLGSSPEEYEAYLKKEIARWDQVVKQAGIVPE